MSLRIELTPEVEADLGAQAAKVGVPLEDYVRAVLEQHLSPATSHPATMTFSERAQAFEEWVQKFPHRRTEPLSDEALTRESFY